jgi:hypothetical protein
MSDQASRIVLKSDTTGSNTEVVELDGHEFPRLVSLLRDPNQEQLREELRRLVGRYWRPRAERWNVKLLARLVYIGEEGALQSEPAFVQDISRSGIKLSVKRTAHLELLSLTAARVQLMGTADDDELLLDIPSWFVRVAAVSERSVSLAFTFDSLDDDQLEILGHLKSEFEES